MSTNSGPGYARHPEHHIETKPAGVRVQVAVGARVIADSQDAIRLEESGYPAVYYMPRADVMMDRLLRSSHQSHCPFKGVASYYSCKDGPENVAWSYEAPYDEVSQIKGRIAFYADRVDSIMVG
jgi:uncharacterized protein (DUF427 family)